MSRRNQSRRRQSYGRRQHEVRERRPDETRAESGWLGDSESELDTAWTSNDTADERTTFGDSFGAIGQ